MCRVLLLTLILSIASLYGVHSEVGGMIESESVVQVTGEVSTLGEEDSGYVNKLRDSLANLESSYSTCSSNLASTTIQLIQTEKSASNFDVHLRLAKNELALAKADAEHCALDKEIQLNELRVLNRKLEAEKADAIAEISSKVGMIEQMKLQVKECLSAEECKYESRISEGELLVVKVCQWVTEKLLFIVDAVNSIHFSQMCDNTYLRSGIKFACAITDAIQARFLPMVVHIAGFLVDLVEHYLLLFKMLGERVLNNALTPLYISFIQPCVVLLYKDFAVPFYAEYVGPTLNDVGRSIREWFEANSLVGDWEPTLILVQNSIVQMLTVIQKFWNRRTSFHENLTRLHHGALLAKESVVDLIHFLDTLPEVHFAAGSMTNLALIVTVSLTIVVSSLVCLCYKAALQLMVLVAIYLWSPQVCAVCIAAEVVMLLKPRAKA